MSAAGQSGVDRAHEEIAAASVLAEHGLTAWAVSCADYTAFCAAEAPHEQVGETRSKHSGVTLAFASIVVREHGVDARAGQFRSLFERRSQVDYSLGAVLAEEADLGIVHA